MNLNFDCEDEIQEVSASICAYWYCLLALPLLPRAGMCFIFLVFFRLS